jgi:nucleoside-diphosphate-sugar epimerase
MDLFNKASIDAALKDITFVVHTACPVFLLETEAEEQKMVADMVACTTVFLEACARHRVKRVVYTSSIAAIRHMPDEKKPAVFNETHWADLQFVDKPGHGYHKAKLLVEKLMWEFHASLPVENRFELVSLAIGQVMGPCNTPVIKSGQMSLVIALIMSA